VSRFRDGHEAPLGPPPEVLAQLDMSWERAQEMCTGELELHFEVDRELGHVWAELRTADGAVAGTLTASEAVAIACGDVEHGELEPVPALAAIAAA
jgi:hypothetical protein